MYIYVCVYIHMYIYTYIHMYIYTYIHTHMYLNSQPYSKQVLRREYPDDLGWADVERCIMYDDDGNALGVHDKTRLIKVPAYEYWEVRICICKSMYRYT